MFQLNVCLLNFQFLSFSSQHCAYALVRFRHKNHSVRVRKTSWFGLKYLFWSSRSQTEMVRLPVKIAGAFLHENISKRPRVSLKISSVLTWVLVVIFQPVPFHLLMWKSAKKHLIWTWFATFGTNVNFGRICGLNCCHYILPTDEDVGELFQTNVPRFTKVTLVTPDGKTS